MKTGDQVRRLHYYDGSDNAGKVIGPILTVIAILDQPKTDGPSERQCIAALSDGKWEFVWNLATRCHLDCDWARVA